MEWSIQQLARLTGTTSRTLRHYDEIGILPPSRIGNNGYRYYDERSLVRLQRVLLLRELGLGLAEIHEVLAEQSNEITALTTHLVLLKQEQERLANQLRAVEHTINALKGQEPLMAEEMFQGFDHTEYKAEVEDRWGKDAYAKSNTWWTGISKPEQKVWQEKVQQLSDDWKAAAKAGSTPDSDQAMQLAERHIAWLTSIPGTPMAESDGDIKAYVLGLAKMYVADPRFAKNYGGIEGATFVRDALHNFLSE